MWDSSALPGDELPLLALLPGVELDPAEDGPAFLLVEPEGLEQRLDEFVRDEAEGVPEVD